MTRQHRILSGLDELAAQRSETVRELIQVCDNFMQRLTEEKNKIVSMIFPVAILVSASKKTNPNADPMKILAKYRFDKNPNAGNVLILSELYDLYEYTENIKAMLVEGNIPEDQQTRYQSVLEAKLLEKEEIASKVSFASMQEIDEVFAGISQFEGDESE